MPKDLPLPAGAESKNQSGNAAPGPSAAICSPSLFVNITELIVNITELTIRYGRHQYSSARSLRLACKLNQPLLPQL